MIQLSLHAREGARIEGHVSLNGTAWVSGEDDRDKAVLFLTPEAARQILQLPQGVEPIAFTPLGYSADTPSRKLRKKMEELVHYERW